MLVLRLSLVEQELDAVAAQLALAAAVESPLDVPQTVGALELLTPGHPSQGPPATPPQRLTMFRMASAHSTSGMISPPEVLHSRYSGSVVVSTRAGEFALITSRVLTVAHAALCCLQSRASRKFVAILSFFSIAPASPCPRLAFFRPPGIAFHDEDTLEQLEAGAYAESIESTPLANVRLSPQDRFILTLPLTTSGRMQGTLFCFRRGVVGDLRLKAPPPGSAPGGLVSFDVHPSLFLVAGVTAGGQLALLQAPLRISGGYPGACCMSRAGISRSE